MSDKFTKFQRLIMALENRSFIFVHRTGDGNSIYRRGDQWAIVDSGAAVLRVATTELTADGAEGPLLDRITS